MNALPPCPPGFQYVELENGDIMLVADHTTPEPIPMDEAAQRAILGDAVYDALNQTR